MLVAANKTPHMLVRSRCDIGEERNKARVVWFCMDWIKGDADVAGEKAASHQVFLSMRLML